jgi:hypothetical protein
MSVVRGHHRELVDGNRHCSCRKNHSHNLPFITKVYTTHPVSVKSSHSLLHSHTCICWNSEFWVSVR